MPLTVNPINPRSDYKAWQEGECLKYGLSRYQHNDIIELAIHFAVLGLGTNAYETLMILVQNNNVMGEKSTGDHIKAGGDFLPIDHEYKRKYQRMSV